MTIASLIDYVNEIKPNAFSDATKLVWVNEVEGMVQSQVLLKPESECTEYTSTSSTLIVLPPHSKLYAEYLMARIDYANGEYDKYQNTMEMFNAFWEEYKAWYQRVHRPLAYRGFRTMQAIFDYVDEVRPNEIASATKLVWLNEVEGKVQTEILLWNESECFVYNYASADTVDVYFPDEHTLAFADPAQLRNYRPGGVISDFSPGAPYAGNAFSAQTIQAISDIGLVFKESFSDTGTEPVSTAVNYSGQNVVMLVEPPHNKIYADYIVAMIDYFRGDFEKYRESRAKFNDSWGEFSRWFARTYRPADMKKGCSCHELCR